MSDPVSQAKQARETLARALGALQSDPSVPPQLGSVAEPVAAAMGALHAIERTGNLSTAPAARDNVRQALGMLQGAQSQHPAVATAMESVAGSLGIVFGLVKMSEQAPTAVAPQPAQPAYAPPQQPAYAPPAQQQAWGQQPAQPQPAPVQARPQPAPAPAPAPAPQPAAAPQIPANAVRFEASLGTNSATNFYKGLSGNDVIEHGGLFVATYNKIPRVGTPVALRVSLPGGYEFEAMATVAWTREQRGGDSEPGFGARFTQITPEARQLVYRYVRNREPLFHDDF